MASVLPSNLSFFMARLQGVGTSHFKVNPQTTGEVKASNIVRFELPSNTLLNFRSIRLMLGNVSCSPTDLPISLPNDMSSMIERCSVYIGGVLVANGFNGYNTLVHAKAALQGYKCGALSHPEMVRNIKYHDAVRTALGATNAETYVETNDVNAFCIDNFEGFLGTCEPSIMDTGAVSTIVIEFQMADATVCSSSGGRQLEGTGTGTDFTDDGTTNPVYTIKNMTLQVEVLQLATNVLDTIVEQRISQVGYLSIPFKNYFSYSNTHTTSTRFNCNSSSWDRLWAVFRPELYNGTKAAVRVKGYKKQGAYTSASSGLVLAAAGAAGQLAVNITQDIGIPEYDIGGSGTLNTNTEKYKPYYFNFNEPRAAATTDCRYQLQINSANIPSYPMTCPELYAMSMNSLDYYDKSHKITLDQYKHNYFVACWRFCLPDSEYSRLASGIDCRGVSSSCSLNTLNTSQGNVHLYCECTSELRIGAGRQIEVVV
jgi:hypothetical protein